MFKQLFIVFFCSVVMVSCSYFDNKLKREPIQKVDTIVDFNTVDAFPLFPNCKEIPSRKKQKICFQIEMSQHIYAALKKYQLTTTKIINDTVLVKLKVDFNGKISLTNIKIAEETKMLFPTLDSLIAVSLQSLPTIQPAIKRNMPVTTEFSLPIVLKN